MSHVFISYARIDREFANRLVDDLRLAGLQVWFDRSSISFGSSWEQEIVEAIRTASAVLVIISPNSARSEWVQRETLLAIEFKKPILPIWIAGETSDFPPLLVNHKMIDARQEQYPHTISKLINSLMQYAVKEG